VILGVVAIPTDTSQLQPNPDPSVPDYPLFLKTGLTFLSGTPFDLAIAPESTGMAKMSWSQLALTTHIHVPACVPYGAQTPWFVYPGGFWLRQPACIAINITVGDRQQIVHLPIGAPCADVSTPSSPPVT
jgi:hypothetical protein